MGCQPKENHWVPRGPLLFFMRHKYKLLTKYASVMIAILTQREFITVTDQTYQQILAVLQSKSVLKFPLS